MNPPVSDSSRFLPRTALPALLEALTAAGYRCVGPRVQEGAIVYGDIAGEQDLPQGIGEQQAPGQYRLRQDNGPRCFTWATGPQALKPLLFKPRESLWQVERDAAGALRFRPSQVEPEKLAVLGVRACDLAALGLQDRHFLSERGQDPAYAARRRDLLLIAVNCTHPAATCFCVSTGDGPQATEGYDLALDELDDGYVVTVGTATGERLLQGLNLKDATAGQRRQVEGERQQARDCQTRGLPSTQLRDALFAAWQHPRWQQVAERCLSCGNCTSVCPTCFCHREADDARLDGAHSTHYREWDSCFTQAHSYIHGITLRAETLPRYRQWLTHKLGSWHDQYGRSGCVGCGRCITWCPVGIDITEEVAALLQEPAS